MNLQEMFDQGDAHQKAGRISDAERIYRDTLAIDETLDLVNINLSAIFASINTPEYALIYAKRAIVFSPFF